MSSSDASDELRMLRAKAYGPGGGVSDAELARLRELEGSRHPSFAQPLPEPVEGAPAAAAPPLLNEPQKDTQDVLGALSEQNETKGAEQAEHVEAEPAPASQPESARRRWPLFAVASIAALAIGLGIGWGVWGWDSHASALAAAHADTQAELEAEELYDPGTIVPVAEQYGLVIWRADRSDGEEVCVIITASEQPPRDGCVTYEQLEDSVWPNASSTIPDGEEKAGQSVVAGLIPTLSGELVPFNQVWDNAVSNWESQYSEEELRQLREIEAEGHMASALSIVGYDGDTAVWSTWETGGFCVLVSGDAGVAQACTEEATGSVSVTAPVGGMSTRYVVTQTERRGPQLTIYKDVDTDYYLGSGDDPQFDDLFPDGSGTGSPELDDKTGP